MVRRVFRADDGKFFRTEAETIWHEQHVLALGKLSHLDQHGVPRCTGFGGGQEIVPTIE